MPGFPGTADALQTVFMDADGPHSLTAVAIPSGQSIALLTAGQPSAWQNIAKGGYPILPPGALVLGTPSGYTGFGAMTPNQAYQYSLTNVTDYGETLESAVLTVTAVQMGTNTSVRLNLPPDAQSTTDVKVRARRLYRSTAGGTTRGFVAQINDMNLAHYIDGLSDTALGDAPPSSDTSGAVGAVSVVSTDGAYSPWTEKQYGSALSGGQFSVDYGFDANGGTVHFAAIDVGKHITITFTASIALTSAFFNSQIQAIKDIRTVLGGTPQGGAADVTTRLSTAGLDNLPLVSDDVASLYGVFPNADPAYAPSQVTTATTTILTPGSVRMAIVGGHFLAIGGENTGSGQGVLYIFDILGKNPTLISTTAILPDTSGGWSGVTPTPSSVVARGSTVYIASPSNGAIYAYDVSNKGVPTQRTEISTGFTIHDIVVWGPYLVASFTNNPVQVYDISDPNAITLLATYALQSTSYQSLDSSSDWVATAETTHVKLFNPRTGTLGQLVTESSVNSIAFAGGSKLAVAKSDGTFQILNVGNTGGVTSYAVLTLGGNPTNIAIWGRYAAVSNTNGTIAIVDMFLRSAPVLVDTITLPAGAVGQALEVFGNTLFVTSQVTSQLLAYSLSGLDLSAANIGALDVGTLAAQRGRIERAMDVGGLRVGQEGAFFGGDVAMGASLFVEKGVRQIVGYYSTQAANYSSQFQSATNNFSDWGPLIKSTSNGLLGGSGAYSPSFTHGTETGYGVQIKTRGGPVGIIMGGRLNCQNANDEWLKIGLSTDGGNVLLLHEQGNIVDTLPACPGVNTAGAIGGYTSFYGVQVQLLNAGLHTIYPLFQCGGPGGVSNAFRIDTASSLVTGLWMLIVEFG